MNLYTVIPFLCVVLSVQFQATASEWQFLRPKIPPLEYTGKTRATTVIYSIKQRINHFSWLNRRTFNMRYAVNTEFYNGTGPMYLFLSGENYLESVLGYLYTGLMYDIANKTGAAMYMLEHRYYGESVPNGNLRIWNMRNLRVKQALADIAEFIKASKAADTRLGKVIVFGGSYTASLATWARKTYPDLIDGAVAASGIYKMQINNYQYLEGFQKDVNAYPNCSTTIQNGVQAIDQKLSSSEYSQVAKDLNITSSQALLAHYLPFFKQAIFNTMIVTMSSQAQYDRLANYSVAWMCGNLTYNSSQLDDYTRLTTYFRNLTNSSSSGSNSTRESDSNRAWSYQVCTELGNFVTTSSTNQPFGNTVPLSFWRKVCTIVYTPLSSLTTNYHSNQLAKAYGSDKINVTRVIFVGGTLDPWQALNIQNDLNSEAPAIVIPETSHCAILLPASRVNTTDALAARVRITQLVTQWGQ